VFGHSAITKLKYLDRLRFVNRTFSLVGKRCSPSKCVNPRGGCLGRRFAAIANALDVEGSMQVHCERKFEAPTHVPMIFAAMRLLILLLLVIQPIASVLGRISRQNTQQEDLLGLLGLLCRAHRQAWTHNEHWSRA
jgi:hypothetical protein